jgi:hypothetical protein
MPSQAILPRLAAGAGNKLAMTTPGLCKKNI